METVQVICGFEIGFSGLFVLWVTEESVFVDKAEKERCVRVVRELEAKIVEGMDVFGRMEKMRKKETFEIRFRNNERSGSGIFNKDTIR